MVRASRKVKKVDKKKVNRVRWMRSRLKRAGQYPNRNFPSQRFTISNRLIVKSPETQSGLGKMGVETVVQCVSCDFHRGARVSTPGLGRAWR